MNGKGKEDQLAQQADNRNGENNNNRSDNDDDGQKSGRNDHLARGTYTKEADWQEDVPAGETFRQQQQNNNNNNEGRVLALSERDVVANRRSAWMAHQRETTTDTDTLSAREQPWNHLERNVGARDRAQHMRDVGHEEGDEEEEEEKGERSRGEWRGGGGGGSGGSGGGSRHNVQQIRHLSKARENNHDVDDDDDHARYARYTSQHRGGGGGTSDRALFTTAPAYGPMPFTRHHSIGQDGAAAHHAYVTAERTPPGPPALQRHQSMSAVAERHRVSPHHHGSNHWPPQTYAALAPHGLPAQAYLSSAAHARSPSPYLRDGYSRSMRDITSDHNSSNTNDNNNVEHPPTDFHAPPPTLDRQPPEAPLRSECAEIINGNEDDPQCIAMLESMLTRIEQEQCEIRTLERLRAAIAQARERARKTTGAPHGSDSPIEAFDDDDDVRVAQAIEARRRALHVIEADFSVRIREYNTKVRVLARAIRERNGILDAIDKETGLFARNGELLQYFVNKQRKLLLHRKELCSALTAQPIGSMAPAPGPLSQQYPNAFDASVPFVPPVASSSSSSSSVSSSVSSSSNHRSISEGPPYVSGITGGNGPLQTFDPSAQGAPLDDRSLEQQQQQAYSDPRHPES